MMGAGSFAFYRVTPWWGGAMARGVAYRVNTWLVGLSGLVLASLSPRCYLRPLYTGQLPAYPTQL